ncbi:MAG TPA: adenosylcobinamide amidohydrolase [Methylomirabilota bacterium]|nr:adenosylcobinamide amidohydrolase [Methylomirabilota bacterium]
MTTGHIPWTVSVRDRTLIVSLPEEYRVLSWAPLQGGFSIARSFLNHQVRTDEYPSEEPGPFLLALARRLGVAEPTVGLMTGVVMERLVRRVIRRDALLLECFATVGVSNALAVGDAATYEEKPGTINIITLVNQPLTDAALIEAVGIVTEAKTRALLEAKIRSTVSDSPATGTGTDCVAVGSPGGTPAFRYCGKHTVLGELLGRVTYGAIVEGLRRAHNT